MGFFVCLLRWVLCWLGWLSWVRDIRLIFTGIGELSDTIADFKIATDRLFFTDSVFAGGGDVAGGSKTAASAAQVLVGSGATVATDEGHRWIYNTSSNVLSYDADGNAGGYTATIVATFNNPVGSETAESIAGAIAYVDSTYASIYFSEATLAPTTLWA